MSTSWRPSGGWRICGAWRRVSGRLSSSSVACIPTIVKRWAAIIRVPVPPVGIRRICWEMPSRGTSAMPARAPCSNLRLCPPALQVSVLGIILAGARTRAFLLLKAPSGETTNGADRKNVIMGSRGEGRPGGVHVAWRGLVGLLVLVVALFDWNALRPGVSEKASDALQRPVAIEGDLNVDWQWRSGWLPWPHVTARNIVAGQPEGFSGGDEAMARIEYLGLAINP